MPSQGRRKYKFDKFGIWFVLDEAWRRKAFDWLICLFSIAVLHTAAFFCITIAILHTTSLTAISNRLSTGLLFTE